MWIHAYMGPPFLIIPFLTKFLQIPRISPKSTPNRSQTDPKSILNGPQIDNKPAPNRPQIDLKSTRSRSQIDPKCMHVCT